MKTCTCSQEGDSCPAHPPCACGCQRHAHRGGPCIAGKMRCHGCDGYRPAQLKVFQELDDTSLEYMALDALLLAYKNLRAHHVEETTALWTKISPPAKAVPSGTVTGHVIGIVMVARNGAVVPVCWRPSLDEAIGVAVKLNDAERAVARNGLQRWTYFAIQTSEELYGDDVYESK